MIVNLAKIPLICAFPLRRRYHGKKVGVNREDVREVQDVAEGKIGRGGGDRIMSYLNKPH